MNVTNAYMYTVKDLPNMFDSIRRASVPPKFTNEFLRTLGFKSSNDRAFINVLKGLGFLDSNSTPTPVYAQYRGDKDVAKKVLGQQIKKAYEGLYLSDESAHTLSVDTIKGKLATMTGKDESVAKKMASTFKSLASLADFKEDTQLKKEPKPEEEPVASPALPKVSPPVAGALAFSHVLYINLPATRDVAIYDAIFKSLREHLL